MKSLPALAAVALMAMPALTQLSGPPAGGRTGQFAQSDEADFPVHGHFRLEFRDERTLTGSYQPDGTAIPFRWNGTRLWGGDLTEMLVISISDRMDRMFFPVPTLLTTVRN